MVLAKEEIFVALTCNNSVHSTTHSFAIGCAVTFLFGCSQKQLPIQSAGFDIFLFDNRNTVFDLIHKFIKLIEYFQLIKL